MRPGRHLRHRRLATPKWSTRLGAGQFDAVVFAWQGNPLLTAQMAEYKTPPDKTNLQSNYQYYSNPEVDKLLDQVVGETDQRRPADLLNQADTIMWQDLNTIPLFQFPDIASYSNQVSDVIYNPSQQGPTWNIQQWAVRLIRSIGHRASSHCHTEIR